MSKANLIWNLAKLGVAILLVVIVVISLSRVDEAVNPSSNSFDPSGAKAFRELLTKSGYRVSDSPFIPRHTLKKSLCIEFVGSMRSFDRLSAGEDAVVGQVRNQLAGGDSVLLLGMSRDSETNLHHLQDDVAISLTSERRYNLRGVSVPMVEDDFDPKGQDEVWEPIWKLQNGDDISGFALDKEGSGYGIFVPCGVIALNQNLDKAENAALLLDLVRSLTGPDRRDIVFVDGSFNSSSNPNLFDVLGPWSAGAWSQLILLALVMVWGVSVRFGLPVEERSEQMSGRMLLDGMADTMARGKHADWAVAEAVRAADAKVRARLGIPRSASILERNRFLPPALVVAFHEAEIWSGGDVAAIRVVANLEAAVSEWMVAVRGRQG